MTNLLPPVSRFPRTVSMPGLISPGPGQPGPIAGLPAMLMNGTKTFQNHSYDMGQQANNYITHNQRVIGMEGDTQRDIQDNLDWAMPHFKGIPLDVVSRYTARSSRILTDMPAVMISWPAFNRWLKSEEGRRAYGGDTDCKKLKADYRCTGVLLTAPSDDYRQKSELKVTTIEGKRSKLPNVWAATGCPVQRGDYLYAVWVRLKLEDKEAKEAASNNNNQMNVSDDIIPGFYWQIQPFIMRGPHKPPSELLQGPNFTGDHHFFGVVFDVWSTQAGKPQQQAMIARRAIFPDSADPEAHRRELTQLLHVEMQIGVH